MSTTRKTTTTVGPNNRGKKITTMDGQETTGVNSTNLKKLGKNYLHRLHMNHYKKNNYLEKYPQYAW